MIKMVGLMKKYISIKRVFLVMLVCLAAVNAHSVVTRYTNGTDFWLTFPYNGPSSSSYSTKIVIAITSLESTEGDITYEGKDPNGQSRAFSYHFIVNPDIPTYIDISEYEVEIQLSDEVEFDKGIHITSERDISVTCYSKNGSSSDAFLCYPTSVGKVKAEDLTYMVGSYNSVPDYQPAFIAVVATTDNTNVIITPSVELDGHPANAAYTVTLNQGDTYLVKAKYLTNDDLTGTTVTSSNTISVFSGVQCANIPLNSLACEYLIEQNLPLTYWGSEFNVAPFALRNSGYVLRVVASSNNTTITINGTSTTIAYKGKFFEQTYTGPVHVTSNKSVQVIQFSQGSSTDNVVVKDPRSGQNIIIGDPSMVYIAPTNTYSSAYRFNVTGEYPFNYANIYVPEADVKKMYLDNEPINETSFKKVGSSTYMYAQVPLNSGFHTIYGASGFGAMQYGHGPITAYATQVGQAFESSSTDYVFLLKQDIPEHVIGDVGCVDVIATIYGYPVPNLPITFKTTGVNSIEKTVLTDNNGVAEFCYSSNNIGSDRIEAFYSGVIIRSEYTDCVTKLWKNTPAEACDDCNPNFMPIPGKKYVISAWVKEQTSQPVSTYSNGNITIDFAAAKQQGPFSSKGPIIDGWQRIEGVFTVPEQAADITINLNNETPSLVYFDDVRIFPFDANMVSYVYDVKTGKLSAQLDENNYATYYEYDEEGMLVRVKKETERGVKTLQESRSSNVKTTK